MLLQYARYRAACFVDIIGAFINLLYSCGNWDRGDLPKIIQLVSGNVQIQMQVCQVPEPVLLSYRVQQKYHLLKSG